MADNGSIHDEMLALFAEIFRGEYRIRMRAIQPEIRPMIRAK